MNKNSYKKILEQIIYDFPHDLDKIETIIKDSSTSEHTKVSISFEEIINSKIWNKEEKIKLLEITGYNKGVKSLSEILDALANSIQNDLLSSFEALVSVFFNRETSLDVYRNTFDLILSHCSTSKKIANYMSIVLYNLDFYKIKELINPHYDGNNTHNIVNRSIMIPIIKTKDVFFISKYISFIDDINIYLNDVIDTGSTEILDLFIANGANLNYVGENILVNNLSPIKIAIKNNDLKMFETLKEKGVNLKRKKCDNRLYKKLRKSQSKKTNLNTSNIDENKIEYLKFKRESSPLEYATVILDTKYDEKKDIYEVKFPDSILCVDINNLSESMQNRINIVNGLKEYATDTDYTNLIIFTFITRDIDNFNEYTKYIIDNNIKLNMNILIKRFFDFNLHKYKDMYVPFLEFISNYDKNVYGDLINYYLDTVIVNAGSKSFYMTDFINALLKRIDSKDRIRLNIMPYCKDIKTVKELISLSFSINDTDTDGKNIMYHLLCDKEYDKDLTKEELELFEYLLDKIDLSHKDKNGKLVLYYAMQKFSTRMECIAPNKTKTGTLSNIESCVAKLINKMKSKDVLSSDIREVLESRINYMRQGILGDQIYIEYVLNHHKELFDALSNKGFVFNDEILNKIFNTMDFFEYSKKKNTRFKEDTINVRDTLEYTFTKLDKNTDIQILDIDEKFSELKESINEIDDFNEALIKYLKFNSQIVYLNLFYKNKILKKSNPKRYMNFAETEYKTKYHDLDVYLLRAIFMIINKFGTDNIATILDLTPNLNINSYVVDEDVGISYFDYMNEMLKEGHFIPENNKVDDEENPQNILFTGGLMQYAVLTNNYELMKTLFRRGAKLNLNIDGVDHTWDYVNSDNMNGYFELVVGEKRLRNLDSEEKEYYYKLVNNKKN